MSRENHTFEAMARKYHSLLLNSGAHDAPSWGVEFGDYDRECVELERDEYLRDYPRKALRIISTSARQADIAATVAKLNDWRSVQKA